VDLTDAQLSALPKAELHVHLEGSMPPQTLLDLAARHGVEGLPTSLDAVREFYDFRDFAHFVDVYRAAVTVLRDGADFAALAYDKGAELASHGVRYAEVFVTPQLHAGRGIAADEVFGGLEDGRRRALRDHGVELVWMADIPGEEGLAGADATLALLLDHRPPGFVALGLGGPEIGVPRPQFAPHFEAAIAAGYHSVPHAGETTGPQTVWDALEHLKAERIGHGTSSVQDPALVAHLREHRTPVDVSITSNLCTRAVATLGEHPLPAMVEAGLNVTINTDDPPMFGTDLSREFRIARDLVPAEALLRATRAGFENSLLPAERKAAYLAEFDAVVNG
jgi:aminodeoxyfutalosine deaminase